MLNRSNGRHHSQVGERPFWEGLPGAYDPAIGRCSTAKAPWYIVPANRRWNWNWTVSQLLIETLEGMKLTCPYPHLDLEALTTSPGRAA